MAEAQIQNDAISWGKLDIDLHHQIFTMAENDRAMNIIENLNDQWNRVRIGFSARTGRMARSIIEHKAIVDAIIKGDADLAEKEMVDHLKNVWDELINLLENMVLPFTDEGV
jgi:DNA-binding GntR family transcriptional regulator